MTARLRKLSPSYWESLSAHLHVDRASAAGRLEMSDGESESLAAHLASQGYFISPRLLPLSECDRLIAGIDDVVAAGWSPTWALLYDDIWSWFRWMRPLAERMLGQDCSFVTGNYVFVVPSDDSAGGWGLHRDLPFENSLCSNGMPRIMSFWLALTEAGPRNSCLYCLPASRDPNYPSNLAAQSIPRVEDVECMPAERGQVIGLNHALLHWGSRSSSRGIGRRVSVVFDLQRSDVPPYHCARLDLSGPSSFEQRAAFVAHVVLWLNKYNVPFSTDDIQLAKDLLRSYRGQIELSANFDADFWPDD